MVWALCMCSIGIMVALVVPLMAKYTLGHCLYEGFEEFDEVVTSRGWVSYVVD